MNHGIGSGFLVMQKGFPGSPFNARMAFGARTRQRVSRMSSGDRAIVYVARQAFGNPRRDRARLGGVVQVTRAASRGRPVRIGDREYPLQVPFRAETLLPERQGPEVGALAPRLSFVKRPEIWGQYFRVSPLEVSRRDFLVLRRAVKRIATKLGIP